MVRNCWCWVVHGDSEFEDENPQISTENLSSSLFLIFLIFLIFFIWFSSLFLYSLYSLYSLFFYSYSLLLISPSAFPFSCQKLQLHTPGDEQIELSAPLTATAKQGTSASCRFRFLVPLSSCPTAVFRGLRNINGTNKMQMSERGICASIHVHSIDAPLRWPQDSQLWSSMVLWYQSVTSRFNLSLGPLHSW